MGKKLLSLILALSLCAGLVSTASASSTGWAIGDGIRQGDFGITESGVLRRYYGHDSHIVIPDGVTEIAADVFSLYEGIPDILSVTIPEGVTSIGSAAFINSNNLERVTIPKSLTYIAGDAFPKDCPWLQNMKGDFIAVNGILLDYRGPGGDVVIPGGVSIVGCWAFADNTAITSVTVPGTVRVLDGNGRSGGAFSKCTSLKTVTIADGVEKIGGYVFSGCISLTDVTIPASVKEIDSECTEPAYSWEYGRELETNPDLTIHGVKGSAAEAFARELGYRFVEIGGSAQSGQTAQPGQTTNPGQTTKPSLSKVKDSGSVDLPKLSKEEITELLKTTYYTHTGEMYAEYPKLSAAYAAGKVNSRVLEEFLDRLNVLRRLAGLPEVKLNEEFCTEAQYCTTLLAATGQLSHSPTKPADMDDAFFRMAQRGASSSNLYSGIYQITGIDELMDDTDSVNISDVGHRRWQLNPIMTQVGFGFTDSPYYGNFLAVHVLENREGSLDYGYIAWPASGNFPNNLVAFHRNSAWSVSLNEAVYDRTSIPNTVVTVTRQSDGKVWRFSSRGSDGYFNLSAANYGRVANCIIFRPEGIDKYEGVYSVSIQGLKDKEGAAADLSYQVDFFAGRSGSSTTTTTGSTTQTTAGTPVSFSDVKSNDWFKPYVDKVSAAGLMTGKENGKFDPNGNLTAAEAMVLAYQIHSKANNTTLPQAAGSWYAPYSQYCADHSLILGTTPEPNRNASRYDMVNILHKAIPASRMEPVKTVSSVPDVDEGSHEAVYQWYRAGIVGGDERGCFNGSQNITRAEVAVILCQINQLL